jgi:hypothetical protein
MRASLSDVMRVEYKPTVVPFADVSLVIADVLTEHGYTFTHSAPRAQTMTALYSHLAAVGMMGGGDSKWVVTEWKPVAGTTGVVGCYFVLILEKPPAIGLGFVAQRMDTGAILADFSPPEVSLVASEIRRRTGMGTSE